MACLRDSFTVSHKKNLADVFVSKFKRLCLGWLDLRRNPAVHTKFTLGSPCPWLPGVRTGVLGGQDWLVTRGHGVRERPGLHPD